MEFGCVGVDRSEQDRIFASVNLAEENQFCDVASCIVLLVWGFIFFSPRTDVFKIQLRVIVTEEY